MRDLILIPARAVSVAERAQILNRSYVDYYVPMRLSPDQMTSIDRFYDIDLDRSVMAMSDDTLAGMALLSVRGDRGWISGVGVLPEHRRRGLARAMVSRLVEGARQAGVREIRLEVIAQNTSAWRLYAEAGFEAARELLLWRRAADADALPIPEERLTAASPSVLLERFDRWHLEPVTWQRDAATLSRMVEAGRLKGYQLEWRGAPAAYCLVSGYGESVALMDVGIDPAKGILTPGRILLQALSHLHWGKAMTISNVPADDPLNRVLAALRFLVTVRQVEMKLTL
ncbi:MAG: GNAT family N-acetyltransferase [Anaerolineae bacterium]|nr:GNAT family N-acetyltransferase [Anaerolineae bacterium]